MLGFDLDLGEVLALRLSFCLRAALTVYLL